MKRSRRLFTLLLLNILVSACTTLGVLLIWDQLYGPLPKGVLAGLLEGWRSPAPALTPQPAGPSNPQAPATAACMVYQVREGETFAELAERYSIPAVQLRSENGFPPDQELASGDMICIPSTPQGAVIIEGVIGAGDLETEHIQLKYDGQGLISLVGWRLEDGSGRVYSFPPSSQLELFGGGAVSIYTRSGLNSVVELYLGLDQAAWYSGTTVTLRDAQGNIQATYVIP